MLVHCLLLASIQLALPLVYHHPLSFLPELHHLCMHHNSLKALAGHLTGFPLHRLGDLLSEAERPSGDGQ